MRTLKETAVTAEREMITPFLQWRYNGRAADNGWNSPINNAQWGTDYLNRTGTAKSNMYDNRPVEKYNPDGSLTLYASADAPGQDKVANWLPAPNCTFSLYLRAYWADKAILDGQWKPPVVDKLQGAGGRALQ